MKVGVCVCVVSIDQRMKLGESCLPGGDVEQVDAVASGSMPICTASN